MKQKKLAKRITVRFLYFAMFLITLNLTAFTTKVKAEDIVWTSVSSAVQLKDAFNSTGDVYIKMTDNITLDQVIEVNAGGNYKLDLNGKKLSGVFTDDANYPQIFRIENSKLQIVNYSKVLAEILCEKKNENHDPPVCFRPLENSELTLGDDDSSRINFLSKNEDRIGDNYIMVINNDVQSTVTIYDCVQCGDTENEGRIWINSVNSTLRILGGEYYGRVIIDSATCYIKHATFYGVLVLDLERMQSPSIDSDAIIYNNYNEQDNFENFSSIVEVTTPKVTLYNSPWDNEILADVEFKGMARKITKLKKMIYVYDDTEEQVYEKIVPASDVAINSYASIGFRENIFEYGKTYTIKVDFVNEYGEIVRTINKSVKCDVTVAEGNCGPVSWKLIANGDFVMSGSGNMSNISTPALRDSDLYRIRRIVAENDVRSIEAGVFGDLPNLQEVVIPDSVTYIASNAFGAIPDDAFVRSGCDNAAVIDFVKATGMKQVLVHQNICIIPEVEGTCASYGVKKYYMCSCGRYYEDTDCAKEITDIEAWKAGDGRIAKKDHTLKTTTTKATQTANGKKQSKCTVCGKVVKTATIYAAKTIKLSDTKYTYDGKVKKPTVIIKDSKGNEIASSNYTVTYPSGRKNVGKYTVKVKFKGNYSGSESLTFTIKPPKTSISKVTSDSNAFTVKWAKKTTQVTGYEIQYSTSKTFAKGNKTVKVASAKAVSKTIKNLKANKTYYVRIRTYKIVNKVKYVSAWSAKKSVKIKE